MGAGCDRPGGRFVGPGDRSAGPGGTEQGTGGRGLVRLVRLARLLRGRRILRDRGSDPRVVTSGQGFVVSESNGRWGKAIEVPGLGALNTGLNADVLSVSCAAAGDRGRRQLRRLRQRGVRGHREERCLGQRDHRARSEHPEQGVVRVSQLGVVRLGRWLRGRRFLPGDRPLCLAGVRHLKRRHLPPAGRISQLRSRPLRRLTRNCCRTGEASGDCQAQS